jgi:dynein heavy chain
MEDSIKKYLDGKNLINKPNYFLKCIQLYETALVRHGFMLVGAAGCAKTSIYATLIAAWSAVATEIKMVKMNPKSIKGQEMYGVMNNIS